MINWIAYIADFPTTHRPSWDQQLPILGSSGACQIQLP